MIRDRLNFSGREVEDLNFKNHHDLLLRIEIKVFASFYSLRNLEYNMMRGRALSQGFILILKCKRIEQNAFYSSKVNPLDFHHLRLDSEGILETRLKDKIAIWAGRRLDLKI